MSSATRNKVERFLKAAFGFCLAHVKEHYIISPYNKQKVSSAAPFVSAVDPNFFPDYASIISTPMYFSKMEKSIVRYITDSDFCTGIQSFIGDVELIHANCYAYNTDPVHCADIRHMVDVTRNYFRFLLRVCLRALHQFGDEGARGMVFASGALDAFVFEESDQPDVAVFLGLSRVKLEVPLGGVLQNLIGAKANSADTTTALRALCTHPLNPGLSAAPSPAAGRPSMGKPKKVKLEPGLALPSPSVRLEPPLVTKLPAKSRKRKSGAATAKDDDDDDLEALFQVSEPPPPAPASPDPFDDDDDPFATPFAGPEPAVKKRKSASAKATPKGRVSAPLPTAPTASDFDFDVDEVPEEALGPAKEAWLVACETVYKLVTKHPYVDVARSTVIVNFFVPVVEANPALAEAYLSVVAKPMDLGTLRYHMDVGLVPDAQTFYRHLLLVFQNAVEFNSTLDNSYARSLVQKCRLLVQYAQWLALEHLPLSEGAAAQATGMLCEEERSRTRRQREEIIGACPVLALDPNPFAECKKLIKDVERCRNNVERTKLCFFLTPVDTSIVADYNVFVRFPADLGSIHYRLDGTLSSDRRFADAIDKNLLPYRTFGEFLADLQRVFKNAIVYNKAHLESDSTGISQEVYDAALFFQERVDALLPKMTVGFADRIERHMLMMRQAQEEQEKMRVLQMEHEREMQAIEQKIINEVKQKDEVFAAEFDVDKRKMESEFMLQQELQKQMLEERKALVLASKGEISSMESDLLIDAEEVMMSAPAVAAEAESSTVVHAVVESTEMLVIGYGIGGQVPKKYVSLIHAKHHFRRMAWQGWADEALTNV